MTHNNLDQINDVPEPPRLVLKLLALVLAAEDQEIITGDFAESYFLLAGKFGHKQARRWLWTELLKSLPSLLFLTVKKSIRRKGMLKHNILALIGMLMVLPAFTLVLGGIAQSGLGTSSINDALNFELVVFHPMVIMGGLFLALALNVWPIVNIKVQLQNRALISIIQIKAKVLNLGLVGLSCLLLTIILIYLLAEERQLFHPLF